MDKVDKKLAGPLSSKGYDQDCKFQLPAGYLLYPLGICTGASTA